MTATSRRRHLFFLAVTCPLLVSALEAHAAPPTATIGNKLTGTIERPFHDLNLLQSKIPVVLLEAKRAPYKPAKGADCAILGTEIAQLDAALGPDLNTANEADASLKTKAFNKAIDAGGDAASSFIPYRGAVRFVTGAEKHDRVVAEAKLAGAVRRAYLKGIGESRGCSYSEAPVEGLTAE